RGQVVALCDLAVERMEEFAKELPNEVKRYTSYEEMCRDPEVDAVFVGTPNQWHVPVALAAVKQGKHVLVTKPLAHSEPAARELVQAAEAAGVVNMMSLSMRFSGSCMYLQDQARRGTFGDLYYARARSVRRNGIPAWNLGFIQQGGGAFRDMGVHVLDAVWSILGHPRPATITGVAGAKFGPRGQGYWFGRPSPDESVYRQFAADDYAGGFIRFDDGTGLQVESFWASHQAPEVQIELFGTEAGATLKPLTLYKTVDGAQQDISVEIGDKSEGWNNIAAHFIACILDGTPCAAPLRHGLQVQVMMEALLESAAEGREVRVETF
ncbi:MAG TPA: Gfo/Idh/MocA family oxidoreductase, partial [Chloroflexota bacterium]|nr:Gfo/Idh/MocA family oxidoreductase [Chloroflexota bacterium]